MATSAHAGNVTMPPTDPDPEAIYGGSEVEECGWPTTVYMNDCTGTLVHPEVVVFAAHCMFFVGGMSPPFAGFGEADGAFARQVPTADCTMFPGWIPDPSSYGTDVAFCTLSEPVLDVPIVPILMGCETDLLQAGQETTLVGFGFNEFGQFGVKHEVVTTINGFKGDEINIGGGGLGTCNGDSGGPAYIQLEDGSWRVFGITSRGITGDCNDEGIYGLIHDHVQWIEDTSGIDITPCHDADGTWNPTEECTEFPIAPGVGETSWAEGCAESRLSGPSATCGEPFDSGGEDTGTDTDDEDTGLPDTGASGDDTGLPGGTAEDGSSGSQADDDSAGVTGVPTTSTGGDGSQDDDPDTVITCTCRSDAPSPTAAWMLLPLLGLLRRRR